MKRLIALAILAIVSPASTNAQSQAVAHECARFLEQMRTSSALYPLPAGAMVCATASDITAYYRVRNDPTAKQKFLRDASRCKMETADLPYTLLKAEDELIIRDFASLREWQLNNATSTANAPFRIQTGMIEVRRVGEYRTAFAISAEWAPYPSKGEVKAKLQACKNE